MLRLRFSPWFWLLCLVAWFATLWLLSSFSHTNDSLPSIVNIDKVAHFGYFFGGGGLLGAYLYRRKPENPNWLRLILTSTLFFAAIGMLDEFHQSFTPGRSGNDPFDWLADVSGAFCGTLVLKAVHRRLK